MQIKEKMNKESIALYVFDDVRLNCGRIKHVEQLVQPEYKLADKKPRECAAAAVRARRLARNLVVQGSRLGTAACRL